MRDMKYIIVKDDVGREIPVIFGPELAHKGVFSGLAYGQRMYTKRYEEYSIVSAGFVEGLGTTSVQCYGESESLGGVKTRGEEDALIICGGVNEATRVANQRENDRKYVVSLLKKTDPATKHFSHSQRRKMAEEYALEHFKKDVDTFGLEGLLQIMVDFDES